MARTYKRDSRGRFASGGGSSGGGKRSGGSGGRKRNKAHVTTTGTFLTRGRAKIAQRERYKQFNSKATAGRSAKDAYKAQAGEKRKAEKVAPKAMATPKRQTRQQKANAYIERISRIGEGRTGVKAARAARIKQSAASFASGLATYHKRQKPKTREDLMKGLAESFGDRGRTRRYSDFRKSFTKEVRPQSGKQSRVRPGQVKRAKGRVASIEAATRAPFSKWNPNPARQNPTINRRSAEVARRASDWYSGKRPSSRPRPLSIPATQKASGPKLSFMQRSRAAAMVRKYGESSTIKNPGRRSRMGKVVTSSSGARARSTGRTRLQAGVAQSRKTRRLLTDMNPSGSRLRRVSKLPQMNIFGGADVGTYLKLAGKGPRRRR